MVLSQQDDCYDVMDNMELPDFLIIPGILYKDRNIRAMDRDVYGIIYWFTRLKNEKCTASNGTIGNLLATSGKVVSNSVSRLAKRGYITVLLDDKNHRIELIPNISYTPSSTDVPPPSPDGTPSIHRLTPPPSTDGQNKNNIIRKVNKTTTNVVEQSYGKEDINECMGEMRKLYPSMTSLAKNRYAVHRLLQKVPKSRVLKAIRFSFDTREEEYAPVITNFLDLERKWDKLELFARRITKERSGQYDKKRGIDARHV